MSSHFSDFMDGVPVKISERYKRPPRIELPYNVNECIERAQNFVDSTKYCATFESNVLSKLAELRNAKETKKNEGRHRLQLLEEAKLKRLDAIAAAEAEEKLKQLSVSEVSYPSTEEISAISPDDNVDKTYEEPKSKTVSPELQETCNIDITLSPMDSISDILQPIQVQNNFQSNSLLDDPDPLQALKRSNKLTKIQQYNHNIQTLTVKDFENDTSSPFDNVELNTINDMELLAQVLQTQKGSCNADHMYVADQINNQVPSCAPHSQTDEAYATEGYLQQSGPSPGIYSAHQNFTTNGYYLPTENLCDNITQTENVDMYIPNYQYFVPLSSYPIDQSYRYAPVPPTNICQNAEASTYIPQPYYYQKPDHLALRNLQNSGTPDDNTPSEKIMSPQQTKSRSRSVPDIVNELNLELELEKHRAIDRSNNLSPALMNATQPSCSRVTNENQTEKKKIENLVNPYDKLSPKSQDMCQNIQGMGFPIDRVVKVCELLGDNDKKIIEALLIMGELMDLGFSERKVTDALVKHEFNRDKALDELVS